MACPDNVARVLATRIKMDPVSTAVANLASNSATSAGGQGNFDISQAITTVQNMASGFVKLLPYLVIAFIVFLLFYTAGKIVRGTMRKLAEKQEKHFSLGLVMGRLAQSLIIFIGLLVAMVIAIPSFKPAQLIQILGLSSVAIGFAFKDILQNFLAGILLLLTEPFRIGDQIKVGDFEGTVEDIQTRATFIKTYDGRRVVIPNGELFNQSVIVNTAYAHRRFQYDIGIGYGDDIEHAKSLILQVLKDDEKTLTEPAPDVLTYDLSGSSVNLRARWWIAPPRRSDDLEARDRVLTKIKNVLTQNGIDLPFPTQQILMHDQTDETDGDRKRQREGWPAGKGEVPRPRELRVLAAPNETATDGAGTHDDNGVAHAASREAAS